MNKKSLNILEFDKILEKLASCAQTEGGRELARALVKRPNRSQNLTESLLSQGF